MLLVATIMLAFYQVMQQCLMQLPPRQVACWHVTIDTSIDDV